MAQLITTEVLLVFSLCYKVSCLRIGDTNMSPLLFDGPNFLIQLDPTLIKQRPGDYASRHVKLVFLVAGVVAQVDRLSIRLALVTTPALAP